MKFLSFVAFLLDFTYLLTDRYTFLGEEDFARIERVGEVEGIDERPICSTTGGYYIAMYANAFAVAVSS